MFYLTIASTSLIWIVLAIYYAEMRYKQGVWDGAFNHFLPHVRREMFAYDKHRAAAIFKSEGEELVVADK